MKTDLRKGARMVEAADRLAKMFGAAGKAEVEQTTDGRGETKVQGYCMAITIGNGWTVKTFVPVDVADHVANHILASLQAPSDELDYPSRETEAMRVGPVDTEAAE